MTHRAMCNVCYIYIEEMKNVTALVTEISSRLQIYPLQVFVRCFAWRARRRALATLSRKTARIMDVSKLQEKKAALEEELQRTEENIYDLEGEYLQACTRAATDSHKPWRG